MSKNKLFIFIVIAFLFKSGFSQHHIPDSIKVAMKEQVSEKLIDDLLEYSSDVYNSTNNSSIASLLDTIIVLSENIGYKEGLAQAFKKYGFYYSSTKEIDSALKYLFKSLDINKGLENSNLEFDIISNIVEAFLINHSIDSANKYSNIAIELSKKNKDSLQLAQSYSLLGKVYTQDEDYNNALDVLLKAKSIYPDTAYTYLAVYYNSLGITYFLVKENDLSLKAYQKSMEYDKLSNEIDIRNSTYNNLGRLYHTRFNDLDSAIYFYEKGLELYDENSKSEPLSYFINLGNIYLEKGELEIGKDFYLQAYNSKSLNSSPMHKTAVTINLGIVYLEMNQLNEAEDFLLKGLGLASKYNFKEFRKNAYIYLSELSLRQNRINDLDIYKDSVISINHQLWDDQLNEKLASLKSEFEYEKLENDNRLLEKQKLLDEKKLESYKIMIFFSIIFAALLAIYVFSMLKSKSKIKEINKLLINKNIELEKMNEYLNKLNITKDKFFSIIAHDLKGPIGSTSKLLEQLEENFDNTDKSTQLNIISSLKKSGINTFNLLENLLDWAKTQKSEFKNNPEKFDLAEHIENVFELLETKANNKSQYLINLVEKDKYIVFADKKMLTAILINLINNSIKFSEIGKRIFVKARKNSEKVYVTVQDEGIGIPSEIRDKIFDLSLDYSALGTQNEKGTGLGLILIKEFINIMDAEIELVKSDSNGTIFTFVIDLYK